MKLWQIAAVLGFEREIYLKYFGELNSVENGAMDIDESIIIKSLEESNLKFHITSHNYLRLYPDSQPMEDWDTRKIEPISALEAYKRFGGGAITEVIDYGSWQIK